MVESAKDPILSGHYADLPPQESTIVRIFLSSTFGDFVQERNKLMKETFPVLQSYCQSLGLELQIVDMRWGVRDESISYHQTSEVCLQEVELCRRLSLGPSFVAFLGNRYGYRPVPAQVDEEDFDILLQAAASTDGDDSILNEWYKKDSNAVPPVYQLQPITNKFPNYISKDQALCEKDRDGWWQTFQQLQRVLWRCARRAHKEGKMSAEQAHSYQMSVTEDELVHGLLQDSSPNDHCLCYYRDLTGITDHLSDLSANRHCDVTNTSKQCLVEVDSDAQELLRDLKHTKIPQVLDKSNIKEYSIPWRPGGVDPEANEHASYLSSFCQNVHDDLKALVDRAVEKRNVSNTAAGIVRKEVLHHAAFSLTKCESFCGREAVLTSVRTYLQGEHKKPLVIHGVSGTGKTSVMAAIANQAHTWLGADAVCILRFLGTTPSSSTIREVLTSISSQLCLVYDIRIPNFEAMDSNEVAQYFHTLIMEVLATKVTSSLLILLDSIDQLLPSDGAHSMMWLPRSLPAGIHIVVSMLPKEHKCLEATQSLLPFDECYVEVSAMPASTGLEIFNTWLSRAKRTITEEQMRKIMDAFSNCPQPLFLRLLFHQALLWKSYTSSAQLHLSKSIADALLCIFSAVEEHHGKVLVQQSFAYLTGSHSGITEAELEDVLSLDDTVLSDVYQYWDPPVERYIRIPSLLWKRIRHEVRDYLVERQADGKTVLAWYHRQFIETATQRYLSDSAEVQMCHENLASYFEGFWSDKLKPVHLVHRNKTLESVSRQVASQPLEFSKGVYNLRKLNELPTHLILANQVNKLKDLALINHEWLLTKLHATSYSNVIQDYNLARPLNDTDISTVSEALALSAHNLKVNPNTLAGQLAGRLIGYSSPSLQRLLADTTTWVEQSQECQLLPVNNCLISPGSPLKTTLSGHPQVIESVVACDSLSLLVSASKANNCSVVNVWDLKSVENCQNTLTLKIPGNSAPKIALSGTLLTASCDTNVRIWKITTGEKLTSTESPTAIACLASCANSPLVFGGLVDGGIITFSVQHGFLHLLRVGKSCEISCMATTSDGDDACCVLTGHVNGAVRVFKIMPNGGLLQCELLGHSKKITSLCILPTKALHGCQHGVISASEDATIAVWDRHSSKLLHTLSGHKKPVKCLQYCVRDEKCLLFSGSLDNTIKVWDVQNGSCIHTLTGHTSAIWCLSVLTDNGLLVTGSKDDYLKVWSIESGECLHTLEGHSSWISCVTTMQANPLIISGSNDKSLKVWQLTPAETSKEQSDRHSMQPECIVASSSGLIVSGAPDSTKVWDAGTGKCLHTFKVSSSALTVSKEYIVLGGKDGIISVWDLTSFTRMSTLEGHTGAVTQLLCSGKTLLSSSADSTIRVWDIQSGSCTHTFSGHHKEIKCMSLSSDHALMATGSYDCTARVWDLVSLQEVSYLKGHTKVVWCIAVSSDNKLVATGSDDTHLKLWSIPAGTCTHTMVYADSVKCVALTNDNLRVLAGAHCAKDQLKAWNTGTGTCLHTYTGHTHAVMCMLLTSGDQFLITGSRDGTIKVWEQASGILLTSFDLQSQIKHISCIERSKKEAVLTATTKSGPIAILQLRFS